MLSSPNEVPIVMTLAEFPRPRFSNRIWWVSLSGLLAVAAGAWFGIERLSLHATSPPAQADGKSNPVRVEVVSPRAGGIDRVCIQPGTLEPFESADLYAKVSGFLSEQHVKIGSRVKVVKDRLSNPPTMRWSPCGVSNRLRVPYSPSATGLKVAPLKYSTLPPGMMP